MDFIKQSFEVASGYVRYGLRPCVDLIWSLSILFGLVRVLEGVVTNSKATFAFGLSFFLPGLIVGLVVKSLVLLFRRFRST